MKRSAITTSTFGFAATAAAGTASAAIDAASDKAITKRPSIQFSLAPVNRMLTFWQEVFHGRDGTALILLATQQKELRRVG